MNDIAQFRHRQLVSFQYREHAHANRIGKNDKLVYMLRHKSRKQADENWAKFRADPEWVKVKAESEKDGVLVDKHEIVFLALTDFSPKI